MNKLLSILFVLFIVPNVVSQNSGSTEIGGNLGVSFTKQIASGSGGGIGTNSNTRVRFNLAAIAEFYFSDAFSIKTKLIYDQKGWNNGRITDTNNNVHNTGIELDYITLPIQANWYFEGTRNWFIGLGFYGGYLLQGKGDNAITVTEITDSFHKGDFGYAVSFGRKWWLNDRLRLLVELDGQGGFNSVVKNDLGALINNNRLSVNIGLMYRLQ
ncbi:porin family protein [Tenacibaculum xiamenense]|uniref:porin family protein n=1 Tax=Tenacibaculum xiamenense TaxID=1261553 RepID=UPI00389427D8